MAFTTLKSGVALAVDWSPTTNPAAAPTYVSLMTPAVTGSQSRIRSAHVKRGRDRELDRFQAGDMDVEVDNRDRKYDPLHATGAYFGNVLPERRARMQAQYPPGGTTYDVFEGFADGWPQQWDIGNKDAVTLPTFTDGFKALQQVTLPNSMFEMVSKTIWSPDHWWKFDDAVGASGPLDVGTAAVTGVNDSATFGGSAVLAFDGGRSSATFAGTGGGILFPTAPWPQSPTAWSVSVWFIANTQTGNENQTILSLGGTSGLVQNYLEIEVGNAAAGDIYVAYSTPTATNSYIDSANVYADGVTPHHVVVTLKNDTTVRIYVDGVSVLTSGTNSVSAFGHDAYSVGSYYGDQFGGTGFAEFKGSVAHLQIDDGTTLTDQNVADLYAAGAAGLAGEDTGTRVGRVLDYVGWSATDRAISTGTSILGAYDLSGGTALDYLSTLADTEQGMFYIDKDGDVTWRSRNDLVTDTRSMTSQATFTDSGSGLGYQAAVVPYDETKVFNDAQVTRQGGASQLASDTTSIAKFFRRTYTKTTLASTDDEALNHAAWAVSRYKDPAIRIEALRIKPGRDPANLWAQALGREIGDRITFVRTPQHVGSAISVDLIIEGIEHDIAADDWTTTFKCSPAEATRYFIIDDGIGTYALNSILDGTVLIGF